MIDWRCPALPACPLPRRFPSPRPLERWGDRPMTRPSSRSSRLGLSVAGLCLLAPLASAGPEDKDRDEAAAPPPAAGVKVDFVRDIRPILARSCYECHGPKKHKAGLRLDR